MHQQEPDPERKSGHPLVSFKTAIIVPDREVKLWLKNHLECFPPEMIPTIYVGVPEKKLQEHIVIIFTLFEKGKKELSRLATELGSITCKELLKINCIPKKNQSDRDAAIQELILPLNVLLEKPWLSEINECDAPYVYMRA